MEKIIYHHDAGHGWYAVKLNKLQELNIAGTISGYSYQKGQTVYLEHDSDASTYFNALCKAKGLETNQENIKNLCEIKESYKERSPIRNYPSYQGRV